MVDFKDIFEIFHKPSVEEIQSDIIRWTDTLIDVSGATRELQMDTDQSKYFELRLRSTLSRGIGGTLNPRHRDRPVLDRVSEIYKLEAESMLAEAKAKNDQLLLSRMRFIDRAANLISATYNNPSKKGNLYESIKETVKTLKREITTSTSQ